LLIAGDIAETDEQFIKLVRASIELFVNNSCFQNYQRDVNGSIINPPALFLSSGILKKTYHEISPTSNGRGFSRATFLLRLLRKKGFNVIVSRDQWLRDLRHNSISNFDVVSARKLHAEQEALVDMFVSRKSRCFVQDLVTGSSFSYLIMRLRLLDQGIYIENHQEYYKNHFWAYSWGI